MKKYDIIVAGGGMAGVGAAFSAARAGTAAVTALEQGVDIAKVDISKVQKTLEQNGALY